MSDTGPRVWVFICCWVDTAHDCLRTLRAFIGGGLCLSQVPGFGSSYVGGSIQPMTVHPFPHPLSLTLRAYSLALVFLHAV